ncbi:MAG: pilus assembly PilX N-terminal domain-containing protein [Patescibacteria group bacterium]
MPKDKQKGVSLIITFFILTILLAVVLSTSIILYSEIKTIKNIGNSVVAFYLAESGIEKTLYYDRKQKPENANRGLCNICNVCPAHNPNDPPDQRSLECICPADWKSGADCDTITCSNCTIKFSTDIGSQKTYNVTSNLLQECKIAGGTLNSFGIFKDVSRAVQTTLSTKVTIGVPPIILNPGTPFNCTGGGVTATIQADVYGDVEEVFTYITGLGSENYNQCYPNANPCTYRELPMVKQGGGPTWKAQWNFGQIGVNYSVVIIVFDTNGNCTQITAPSILCL